MSSISGITERIVSHNHELHPGLFCSVPSPNSRPGCLDTHLPVRVFSQGKFLDSRVLATLDVFGFLSCLVPDVWQVLSSIPGTKGRFLCYGEN